MSHDKPEDQVILFIKREEIAQAERIIESCESCDTEAEVSFDSILDHVTGSDPAKTEYLLELPAKCPRCHENVVEKTRVKPRIWVTVRHRS
jgi:hypothetical protein